MKKLVSIMILVLCAVSILAQNINPKIFNRAFELICDTTAKSVAENEKFNAYCKKHTETLNLEIIQVIEDSDSVSYCLVEARKDSELDFDIALFETINEVVYDGRKFKNEQCFLAGTYTYESNGFGTKTVPYYITIDAFYYEVKSILDEELRRRASQQKE